WRELKGVVEFWIARGVKIFRVDNPHTKPFAFWRWALGDIRAAHPDVIFLSEAFTRAKVMRYLAKSGFSQSYTYFTWRNTSAELAEYFTELAQTSAREYMRPNLFANTPDILHEYLQQGGRPAFEARLVLAGTLSPSYAVYSGYEWLENTAVREGSEEYLDSEKYEVKQRTLEAAPLAPLIKQLNTIRRENPALQRVDDITFLETESEQLIAYVKVAGDNAVATVVNLDPYEAREGVAILPASLGLAPSVNARELLTDQEFGWRAGRHYVRLPPGARPAIRPH